MVAYMEEMALFSFGGPLLDLLARKMVWPHLGRTWLTGILKTEILDEILKKSPLTLRFVRVRLAHEGLERQISKLRLEQIAELQLETQISDGAEDVEPDGELEPASIDSIIGSLSALRSSNAARALLLGPALGDAVEGRYDLAD